MSASVSVCVCVCVCVSVCDCGVCMSVCLFVRVHFCVYDAGLQRDCSLPTFASAAASRAATGLCQCTPGWDGPTCHRGAKRAQRSRQYTSLTCVCVCAHLPVCIESTLVSLNENQKEHRRVFEVTWYVPAYCPNPLNRSLQTN